MITDLNLELRMAYLNVIKNKTKHLTRKKESRDPFSIYSTTIITGRPAKRAREHTGIRAITEICAAVRDFQLWQLNYLYSINRSFIFQHASIKALILYICISPFLYSNITFELIKKTWFTIRITRWLNTSFSRGLQSLVYVLFVLSFSLKDNQ